MHALRITLFAFASAAALLALGCSPAEKSARQDTRPDATNHATQPEHLNTPGDGNPIGSGQNATSTTDEPASAIATQPAATANEPQVFDFDMDGIGDEPFGFVVREALTSIRLAAWCVTGDSTAPSPPNSVCIFDVRNEARTLNLMVAESSLFQDGVITLDLKDSGSDSLGSGAVWRYQDNQSFYAARFCPADQALILERVAEGEYTELARAPVAPNSDFWRTIRIECHGESIMCRFGTAEIAYTDDAIPAAGMVGVYSKGNTFGAFDNLVIHGAPSAP